MTKCRLLNETQIALLKASYKDLGAVKCAPLLGLTVTQTKHLVKRYRHEWGLYMTKEAIGAAMSAGHPDEKAFEDYGVNPSTFMNVQTAEVAYILGLLWADGYLYNRDDKQAHKIVLETVETDFEHFRKALDRTGRWAYQKRLRAGMKPQMRGVAFNKPLVRYLASLDYEVKTNASADKVLATIPLDLQRYWFRGLMDGDGHFVKRDYRINVTSSIDQDWSYLIRLCERLGIGYRISKRSTGTTGHASDFIVRGIRDYLRFCSYIYEGWETDQIGLPRKHQTYQGHREYLETNPRSQHWLRLALRDHKR